MTVVWWFDCSPLVVVGMVATTTTTATAMPQIRTAPSDGSGAEVEEVVATRVVAVATVGEAAMEVMAAGVATVVAAATVAGVVAMAVRVAVVAGVVALAVRVAVVVVGEALAAAMVAVVAAVADVVTSKSHGRNIRGAGGVWCG